MRWSIYRGFQARILAGSIAFLTHFKLKKNFFFSNFEKLTRNNETIFQTVDLKISFQSKYIMQLKLITLELQNRCTVAFYCNLSTAFPLKINTIARLRILDRSQLTFVKVRNIRAAGNGCADTPEFTRAEPLECVINNSVTKLKKWKRKRVTTHSRT